MVERAPQTLEQLARISGSGERKLEAYGESFLSVILDNAEPAPVSDTVAETLILLSQGAEPLEIAHKRDLTLQTVYRHLALGIEREEIDLEDIVTIDQKSMSALQGAFEQQGGTALKPIYELFDGEYDYGVLDCVRSSLKRVSV